MKKILMTYFLSFTILSGSNLSTTCTDSIDKMMKHNYLAQDLLLQQEYDASRLNFSNSIDYANIALENCKDLQNYDFNLMYSFILHSEDQINNIYNLQVDL